MQLLPVSSLSWAAAATDTPKLRSLLLYPEASAYRHCTLHAHNDGLFAFSHERGRQAGRDYARVTIYGNTQHTTAQHYEQSARHILSMVQPDSLKGSAIPELAVGPLSRVCEQHGWQQTYCNPCFQYTCGPTVVENAIVSGAVNSLSPEYQLGKLADGDAALVNDLWSFRSAGSLSMVEELIAGSHTSCIRTHDGAPVAWMLEVEPLCAGMLHVIDTHRRKGLARVVCLDLFSKLQKKWEQRQQQQDVAAVVGEPVGHGVYCYVVEDNTASARLMQSLELRHTGMFTWMGFEKNSTS